MNKEIVKQNWDVIKTDHPMIILGYILAIWGIIAVLRADTVTEIMIGWLFHIQGFVYINMEWNSRNRNRLNALGEIDKRLDTTGHREGSK